MSAKIAIHAACSPGEIRVAVWDGRALLDFGIWRPGQPDGVGDIFRGRVVAKIPSMAGAFVDLGGAENGFLPNSAGAENLSEGAYVAVRVVRSPQGGKGPRLTARLAAHEKSGASGPPGLIARGPGAVERLAALHPNARVDIDDHAIAARLRPVLADRLSIVKTAFADEALATAAENLAQPTVGLPGGATLHVYPTPALTALDVDLGGSTAGRGKKDASQHAANAAVMPEIARQIRLRNLGGAILLDLGGIAIRKRQALAPNLARALAEDPLAPRLLGFTGLGLAEILRPRVHPPLHELLGSPHAAALSALRAAEAACLGDPGHAPNLAISPAIAAALATDASALDEFARRTGHRLAPTLDAALPDGKWRL